MKHIEIPNEKYEASVTEDPVIIETDLWPGPTTCIIGLKGESDAPKCELITIYLEILIQRSLGVGRDVLLRTNHLMEKTTQVG